MSDKNKEKKNWKSISKEEAELIAFMKKKRYIPPLRTISGVRFGYWK